MAEKTAAPRLRITYSKPSTYDDGSACRVYSNEAEGDEVTIKVEGCFREFTILRNTFTGTNDRGHYQRAGEWPLEKAWLLDMLQSSFDQGVRHQKTVIRDTLREVIGI